MRLLSSAEFLAWAAKQGIVIEPEFCASWPRNLVFTCASACARWPLLGDSDVSPCISSLERFACELLARGDVYVWAKNGRAWDIDTVGRSFVAKTLIATLSIPADFDGAIRMQRGDAGLLSLAFVLGGLLGSATYHDVYVVPAQADVILMADHHDSLVAEARDAESLNRYRQALFPNP